MKTVKLIVGCLAFVMGLSDAQEVSAEWDRQKDASWARTRQDFPQSAYPGPFKTRMHEIDAWAKENNPDLHYNTSKPYLIAQMVQREFDAEAARQRQASRQVPVTSSSPSGNEEPPSYGASNRGDLSGTAVGSIWIGVVIIIVVTFGCAWALFWIIRPKKGVNSASALGRKWAAWIVAISTISMLPSFFRKLDGNSFALWAIGAFCWGVIAFIIGWIIGLIKYKGVKGGSSEAVNPPIQSEDAHPNAQKNQEFLNNLPELQSLPDEHEIKPAPPAPPIMKANEYDVTIPEGYEMGDGYVEMIHQTQYSLMLRNHREVRCDADVVIDGIRVGTWRIDARGEIRIERPVHDTGHFTFFRTGTEEASLAGIEKKSENGLISVTFIPEVVRSMDGLHASPLPRREGATGLTGQSKQRFVDAIEIEHDMARAFTIHIRLIAARQDIRPLAPRSTPIPPPLE